MTAPDLSRAVWRKSRSSNAGGSCVEVAALDRLIAVRDSKNPDGPKLAFPRPAWQTALKDIRTGTYDL